MYNKKLLGLKFHEKIEIKPRTPLKQDDVPPTDVVEVPAAVGTVAETVVENEKSKKNKQSEPQLTGDLHMYDIQIFGGVQ